MKSITLIFFFFSLSVFSQNGYRVDWGQNEASDLLEEYVEIEGGVNGFFQKTKNHLIALGYLAASIDSVVVLDSLQTVKAAVFLGEKIRFNIRTVNSEAQEVLTELDGEEKWKLEIQKYPSRLENKLNAIIEYCENNGYPFATISLDSVDFVTDEISAHLNLYKGPLIRFKDPIYTGIDDKSQKLVNSLFGIESESVYDQRLVDRLENRIKEISFWNFSKSPEYEIVNSHCTVYLYLAKKNANSFNAILGLLPKTPKGFNITGDIRVKLINQMNQGELIDVNWRKLLPLTQNLDLHFKYPFMFGTDFGSDLKFDLYKKDTSFLDINTRIALEYYLSSSFTISTFYHNKTASLLSADNFINATTLPAFADVKVNNYGVAFEFQNLNNRLNPVKGWQANLESSVGAKVIRKNALLPDELYEDLDLKTLQYSIKGTIGRFTKISRRNTLLTELSGGYIGNPSLFENELYRLGGLRTIRGFDDETIFASNFILATAEYRFLLDEFSNLFCFGQWMSYDKNLRDSFFTDTPYSVGVGINFQTNTGVFNLSYAVGSERENPLLLRLAKIHVGFVNYF